MTKTRKHHNAQFKAQVALAAFAGDKTLAELSSIYGIHATMISQWKNELPQNAPKLFARVKKGEDSQKTVGLLHRKIGQLQIERDLVSA
jgi:transposase